MTPSGPPTVTGWALCRGRAASLTRTKERTAAPHQRVTYSALTSLTAKCIERNLIFLFTYLFSIINLLILFF